MIASIGESLIDNINGKLLPGGCPYNVARAAGRLGAAVTYYGRISSDSHGREILNNLIDDCVMFEPALCGAPQKTLVGKAVLDSRGNASYVFDYEGTVACNLTKDELSAAFDAVCDIDMVFFGSLALVMEPGCKEIVPAIHSIKTRPRMFLDPNVRPSVIKDPEAYRRMIAGLVGECSIVKASEEDIMFLLPDRELSVAETQFASLCQWNLIVTRGDRGSTWYTKSFRFDCPPARVPKDSVVDTIGCGDVFDAAVMAFIQKEGLVPSMDDLDKATIEEILRYASRAAALNCLREGCDPPYRTEVEGSCTASCDCSSCTGCTF